jgi:hypothetical protein
MTTKRKKIIKAALAILVIVVIVGSATAYYMFNMPHRNVQKAKTDYSLTASQLVTEYLTDAIGANIKYLADDGDSKILEISGTVSKITEDFNGRKVLLLKEKGQPTGISCTFTEEAGSKALELQPGQTATLKGVIRSGANYIEDFGLWENVVMEQCAPVE